MYTYKMLNTDLDWRPTRVVEAVRLVSGVGKAGQPTDVRFRTWAFSKPDSVPNARQPVRHQCKGGHQQDKHGGTILRVAVDLPRHPHQPQEPRRLEQPDQCGRLEQEGVHNWTNGHGTGPDKYVQRVDSAYRTHSYSLQIHMQFNYTVSVLRKREGINVV